MYPIVATELPFRAVLTAASIGLNTGMVEAQPIEPNLGGHWLNWLCYLAGKS